MRRNGVGVDSDRSSVKSCHVAIREENMMLNKKLAVRPGSFTGAAA